MTVLINEIGYMVSNTQLIPRKMLQIQGMADFMEIPAHDSLIKYSRREIEHLLLPFKEFEGYLVLHGEGETDGKRHIEFSSPRLDTRRKYTESIISLYKSIIDVMQTKTRALILHPGRFSKRYKRIDQIFWMVEGITAISEEVPTLSICIESRGGDKQGKVIRATMDDILLLNRVLKEFGTQRIFHCLDIAQAFIVHGRLGLERLLKDLQIRQIQIQEIHVSDVVITIEGVHQLGREIGTGLIAWNSVLKLIPPEARILIETLGGPKVFKRSLTFLNKVGS